MADKTAKRAPAPDAALREPPRTGAHEVVEFLGEHGYRHVFGLPGSQLSPVFHQLQNIDVTYVPTIHESVTVAAADGYSRVAGSAVAFLYMLPGTANGLANIYNASRDDSPLLLIASQQLSTARTELGGFCEGDTVPLVKPFVRLAHELGKGASVRSWLEKARRASQGPTGGPVLLSICEDAFLDPAPAQAERRSVRGGPGAPDVTAVADALRTAERPLLVVGGQLGRLGGRAAVEALAERFNIPVTTEGGLIDALGVAPGHSHFAGSVFLSGLDRDADVVISLGTRMISEASPAPREYYRDARFIAHVNADPRRLEGTRRADWVSASDPAAFAAELLRVLDAGPPAAELVERRRGWALHRPEAQPVPGAAGRMQEGFRKCVAPLHDAMERGWLVDETVGASGLLIRAQTARDGRRYAGTSGASLGWGPGAAAGIALASGEPVTCAIGDGSMRFGALGLWTIKAMNLPVTFVVLDNHGYASTRNYERQYIAKLGPDARPQKPGYLNMDMRSLGPDLKGMIEGFGIPTERVAESEDFRAAIERAWSASANGPNAVILPAGFEDE